MKAATTPKSFSSALLMTVPYGVIVLKKQPKYLSLSADVILYKNKAAAEVLEKFDHEPFLSVINGYVGRGARVTQDYRKELDENSYLDISLTYFEKNILFSFMRKHVQNHNPQLASPNIFNFIINKDGKLTYTNDSFLNITLYTLKDLSNTKFKSLLSDKRVWKEVESSLSKKGILEEMRVSLITKTGEIIPANLRMEAVYNTFGQSIAYKGVLIDTILATPGSESILSSIKQKLDTTEKIATLVAHEVRNPITNINLALEHLKQELDSEKGNVKHTFCIDIIKRNCTRINMLVNQLLNTSVTEYLVKEPCAINKVIERTMDMAIDRIRLNEVTVIKILSQEKRARLHADVEKLTIAFLNIVINAIEAMEAHKGILEIKTYVKKAHVCVQIEDNGKGMKQKQIEEAFKPFYTNKEGGIGLGLTSANNIIQSHKGKVTIEQAEKKGLRFSIVFANNEYLSQSRKP